MRTKWCYLAPFFMYEDVLFSAHFHQFIAWTMVGLAWIQSLTLVRPFSSFPPFIVYPSYKIHSHQSISNAHTHPNILYIWKWWISKQNERNQFICTLKKKTHNLKYHHMIIWALICVNAAKKSHSIGSFVCCLTFRFEAISR